MIDTPGIFSDRISGIKASEIREIFKLLGQKDIISLAGGNPAVESFPNEALAEIAHDVLKNNPGVSLQYNATEGYIPLRNILSERMKKIDSMAEYDELIVTTGAQQAIDLIARVLINEGDGVVAELPSFVGSLNSIRGFGGQLFGVPVLSDGMDLDALENILKTEKIKLIYTIPTFQNPTGVTMPLEKRIKLLELATKYHAPYLLAVGGAGAYLAQCVTSSKIVAFDDLGAEAVRELTIKDFPVIVGIDKNGESAFF